MQRRIRTASLALSAALALIPSLALADGKRDLGDGIAFYENLDTDRAAARLESALASGDLGAEDRAQAYLYLGMVKFELGKTDAAESAWASAFELQSDLPVPEGTSPKTVEALEMARKKAASAAAAPPPAGEDKPLPKVDQTPPPTPGVTPPPADPGEEEGGAGWLLWGGVGAGVVAAAVIVAIVIGGGSSSECEGAGGCATVSFR